MEHFCEPCKRDSERQEAIGFCVDCDEHLCSGCCRAHRKLKISENHVITDSLETRESGSDEITSNSKQCLKHIGNKLECFCTCCNLIACHECMSQGHKACNTVYIPDISCDYDTTRPDDKIALNEKIKIIGSGITTLASWAHSHKTEVKKIREEFPEGLKEFKKDAVASIESTFNQIDKLAENIEEDDVQHCDVLISASKEAMDRLYNEAYTDPMDGLVFNYRKAVEITNNLLETLSEAASAGKTKSHRHSLASLTRIQDLIEAIHEVLSETKDIAIPESQLTNMSTETVDDTEQCQISAAIVTGTRLVIADRGNKKVKVFDTVKKELLAELKLPGLFQGSGTG